MGQVGGVIGGLCGGLVGAAIWAAVAYYTGYENAWIAWGLGALVGFGVMIGTRNRGGAAGAMTAAAIAVAAIVAGKWAATTLLLKRVSDDEMAIGAIAAFVLMQYEQEGWEVGMPEIATANRRELFPPEVWDEAKDHWEGLQEYDREDARREIAFARPEIRWNAFKGAFGPMDLLWVLFAVGTAVKLGGSAGEGEADASLMVESGMVGQHAGGPGGEGFWPPHLRESSGSTDPPDAASAPPESAAADTADPVDPAEEPAPTLAGLRLPGPGDPGAPAGR